MARIYKGPLEPRPEPESMAAQKKAKETRLPRSQAKRKVVNEGLIEPTADRYGTKRNRVGPEPDRPLTKTKAKEIKGHLDQYRDGMKK